MIGLILALSFSTGISQIYNVAHDLDGMDFNGVFTQVEIPKEPQTPPEPEPKTDDGDK